MQAATVAGRPAALPGCPSRGNWGGKSTPPNREYPAIYDAILEAGAKPFGMFALNSLRIEKGYRAWKGDLSTDYSLLEGGLDRFIRFDKPQDFPGKAALLAEKQRGVKKRFVTLTVDAGAADAPYMSTLWHDGDGGRRDDLGRLGLPRRRIRLHRARHAAHRSCRAGQRARGRHLRRAPPRHRAAGWTPVGPRQRPAEGLSHGRPSHPRPRRHHRRRRLGLFGRLSPGAKLGWTDIVLLERKQLTCGTTWHAAGLVGQLRGTQNMTRLAKYSADLYVKLRRKPASPPACGRSARSLSG
jgi:hypothetical protein